MGASQLHPGLNGEVGLRRGQHGPHRLRTTKVLARRPKLARRLNDAGPVDVRGVALARQLLTDGTGPLFWARSQESVSAHAREALVALEPAAG